MKTDFEAEKPFKSMIHIDFIEEVFEIAFGYNAINRGFTMSEVLEELKRVSNEAFIAECEDFR